MFRLLLLFLLLLPGFRQSCLLAQSFPGPVTVRAIQYNLSPDGAALQNFQTQVEVWPANGSPSYTLTQNCDSICIFDNLPQGSTLIFSATKEDEWYYAVSAYGECSNNCVACSEMPLLNTEYTENCTELHKE